ncbi:hypothetical protein Hypma_015868 [Hypsizygus marmoreus]|uniref:Uncharacterized protein n=1 Tax=Hypsizygus marmoreus TaxID=39966 RepID=A0A369KAB0_HYPMA|nr:hypothetical protein Hypma_015868 [Hypsizygus marmoreus]
MSSNVGDGSSRRTEGQQSGEQTHTTGEDGSGDQRSESPELPLFNSEVIREIEVFIERFRSSEISKSDAIIEILSLIRSTDISTTIQDSSFSNYLSTLDSIASQSIEANRRGQHAADGLDQSNGDNRSDRTSGPSGDEVAEILGSIVAEAGSATSSKRHYPSSDDDSSSSGEDFNASGEDGSKSNKKSISESKMPWHRRELKARKRASPSCAKTQKLLKYFGRNPGEVKQLIRLSQTAPLGFPSSEWDNIIKGNPINLDVVLSSLHHLGAPKESTGRLGSTEIKFGQNEPTRKVQTSGDWTSAWNAAIKATIFVFKHRDSELRSYAEYIKGLFASKIPSSHHLIISFDKAIRAEPVTEAKKGPLPTKSISRNSATVLTPPKDARTHQQPAPIDISVVDADSLAMQRKIARSQTDAKHGLQPKYLRYNVWRSDGSFTPTCADWTLHAKPLPPPPSSELNDPIVTKTIRENPSLFAIVTPINVDRFEKLLINHPNQPFVKSVCRGLREGFWPWADTHLPGYPITHDASLPPPADKLHAAFLRSQRDAEISKNRFSQPFGHHLLPGMYSMPIHAVPKAEPTDLRMVTNQSAGEFSLNSMVLHEDIAGYPLDNMRHLGEILLARSSVKSTSILWKSDIAEAYRLMPMHPYWQIKQVNTIDGLRHVDRNGAFGGRGTGSIWISFNALVTWIAIHVKLIEFLCAYSDDSFGPDDAHNLIRYEPYNKLMPGNQVKLLLLWDELGIPHKEKKQVFGSPLKIIGINVNPSTMTMTLPPDRLRMLIDELLKFTQYPNHKSPSFALKVWQRLAGWMNWAFNVFPLLRPSLNNVYPKISFKGKVKPDLGLYVNNAIRTDLNWAINHLSNATGTHVLRSLYWSPDVADFTIYCDACLEGMGFYYPEHQLGFYATVPPDTPSEHIFYYEALCVASALQHVTETFPSQTPIRIIIFTDNTNSVNIFSSLYSLPTYTPILKFFCDILIATSHEVRVLHVPGASNVVADALSRAQFSQAYALVPSLSIAYFQPPRLPLGAIKK